MATEQITEQQVSEEVAQDSTADAYVPMGKAEQAEYLESGIVRIAGMIDAKYADEGQRNLDIGAEANGLARWKMQSILNPTEQDYAATLTDIKNRVRLHVGIKESSIRIKDWSYSAELQSKARDEIGELADNLCYFEWKTLSQKSKATGRSRALAFSAKSVEGRINDGWLGFIQSVAEQRAVNRLAVPADDFVAQLDAFERSLVDPATAAKEAQLAALADNAKKIKRVTGAVSDSIVEALSEGVMTADQVMSTMTGACKALKQPLPKAVGYDPVTVTPEELTVFVKLMMQFKRWDEIRALHATLGKVIEQKAAIDKLTDAQRETLKMKTA